MDTMQRSECESDQPQRYGHVQRSPSTRLFRPGFNLRAGRLTLLMATATPPVAATPITYTLLNASATFGTLGTIDFSGSFTFDPSPPTLDSVMITATGPLSVLLQSPETFGVPFPPITPNLISAISSATFDILEPMAFVNNLTNAPEPIASVTIVMGRTVQTASSVTGEAVPASAPEPTTLALLSGALGLLFHLRTRINRRDRRPPASQPEAA